MLSVRIVLVVTCVAFSCAFKRLCVCVQQLKGNTKFNVSKVVTVRFYFVNRRYYFHLYSLHRNSRKRICMVSKVYALIFEQIEYRVLESIWFFAISSTWQNSMFKCIHYKIRSNWSCCELDRLTLISCSSDGRSIGIDATSLKWWLRVSFSYSSFLIRPNFPQTFQADTKSVSSLCSLTHQSALHVLQFEKLSYNICFCFSLFFFFSLLLPLMGKTHC